MEFTNFIQTQCYQLPPSSVNIWPRYTECDLALTFSLLKMFSLIFCSFFLLCYEMHLICSFTFLVKWCPELDVIFQAYWHECCTVNDYYFLGFWCLFIWNPKAHQTFLMPYHSIDSWLIFYPLPPPWFFITTAFQVFLSHSIAMFWIIFLQIPLACIFPNWISFCCYVYVSNAAWCLVPFYYFCSITGVCNTSLFSIICKFH